ncbi:MAG: DUF3592 domain-containing protein [Anaerolineae bacterium]|nr:DUF3592 domain-containing protein [Anaerolineae bacterium]
MIVVSTIAREFSRLTTFQKIGFLSIALLIDGALILCLSILWIGWGQFYLFGIPTQAKVVSSSRNGTGRYGVYCSITYKYEVEGKEYSKSETVGCPPFSAPNQDTLTVRYFPDQPSDVSSISFGFLISATLFFIFLATLPWLFLYPIVPGLAAAGVYRRGSIDHNSGYFRITDPSYSPNFQQDDRLVWCRQRFADALFWGTKVTVLQVTNRRVKVRLVENHQIKSRYVTPHNLVPEHLVRWE